MKLSEIDWGVLRGAIAFLVVTLVLSGGLFFGVSYVAEQTEREKAKERTRLTRVQAEYQAIDDEQKIIGAYLPQYRALETEGVIGEELRLNWIESLREAARAIKLPSLRYELSPRELEEPEVPLPAGAYKVYASRMRVEAGLLHEGDLATLLHHINTTATGLFTVSNCVLTRNGGEPRMEPNASNISASCELHWFTIRQPEGEGSA